jgi:hypothetical protein
LAGLRAQTSLRLPRPIFLERAVEDSALDVGEHEVAFLNTDGHELLEIFVCYDFP